MNGLSKLSSRPTNVDIFDSDNGINQCRSIAFGDTTLRQRAQGRKLKSVEGQQGWLKNFEFTSFSGKTVVV
jgi:hypothetical protein